MASSEMPAALPDNVLVTARGTFAGHRPRHSIGIALLLPIVLLVSVRAKPQHTPDPARRVTVRFINPKSGKPLRAARGRVWVSLGQYKCKLPDSPACVLPILNVRPGKGGGSAVFVLRDPLPKFVDVSASDLWYGTPLIPVEQILESGMVVDYSSARPPRGYWVSKKGQSVMKSGSLLGHGPKPKGSTKLKIAAKPGEVVIIESKETLWQDMLEELP